MPHTERRKQEVVSDAVSARTVRGDHSNPLTSSLRLVGAELGWAVIR